MKCIACDNLLTERESGAKDEAGNHTDLCGECLPVSREALLDASAATDWQDDGVVVHEETRSDAEYWSDFLFMHWDNLSESWADGLGTMSRQERVIHMEKRSHKVFLAERAAGTPLTLAAEISINAPWVIDRGRVGLIK